MITFETARKFIYRNARPVELARWQYHFEGGSKEAVLNALSCYQNGDGGFGHGLETDYFNPHSSPIQTWQATEILREISFDDKNHPVIQGILRYLESGADFDEIHYQWMNVVPGNNDYPHAIWWEYGEQGSEFRYNPTACLAGFTIRFAEKKSRLYESACNIARQAYSYFTEHAPFEEKHSTRCFIRLYEYLLEADSDVIAMEAFKDKLKEQVNFNICREQAKWSSEYVALPSDFIEGRDSIFYADNWELAEAECERSMERQLPDGSWPMTWQWWTDYREFTLAEIRGKTMVVIDKMRYLKNFGRI